MSDSSQVALRYIPEVTWQTTPGAALTNMRFTSESLDFAINNITSQEIRSDRQISDLVQVGANAQGDVNFEVSAGAMDDFFEGALFSTWGADLSDVGTDVDADDSDNSFNGSSLDSYVVGQTIQVTGFTTAANNGVFTVVSRTASKIVVSGGTLVTESSGDTVTLQGGMMRNGVTPISYTMEKEFVDKTEFLYFKGMIVSSMTLNLNASEIMNGSMTFLGGTSGRDTSTVGTGGPTAAPTDPVLNAVANLSSISEGTTNLTGVYAQSLSITLANNLRGQPAIGVLGNAAIGAGRINVTGNITLYFEDGAMYDKYVAGTPTSILWGVQDSALKGYAVYMPEVKFSTGQILAGGIDQDVVASFDFQAIMDPTLGFTFQLDRFGA